MSRDELVALSTCSIATIKHAPSVPASPGATHAAKTTGSVLVQAASSHALAEFYVADKFDGDATSSGPPSPPSSSGSTTPRLSIAPCPPRLQSLIPPFNYGTVVVQAVYRSSFPQERNLTFLRSLKIRSVLTLVDTEPSSELQQWVADNDINRVHVPIKTNKNGSVNTSIASLCEALLFVMNRANHPLYIHCNQGKHRTGCVVACLRRIQGVPIDEIIEEYYAYAWPKVREGDVELIKTFDPAAVFDYAKANGYLEDPAVFKKPMNGDIRNIDELAAALTSGVVRNDSAIADMDCSLRDALDYATTADSGVDTNEDLPSISRETTKSSEDDEMNESNEDDQMDEMVNGDTLSRMDIED